MLVKYLHINSHLSRTPAVPEKPCNALHHSFSLNCVWEAFEESHQMAALKFSMKWIQLNR